MEITTVTSFAVNKGKVKANGKVILDDAIELKYVLMQGPQDMFVSWAGGKSYTKKDGTKGWDSPIFIKDKAFNDTITEKVIGKYKSLNGGGNSGAQASSGDYSVETDASFASDDIPF